MITVFVNGAFDMLHSEHVKLLECAKRLGNILIIGLNSDDSIRYLKGKNRPINNQNDRKYILESIKYVDKVIIFNEYTPCNLLKEIKPNIVVKGSDYNINTINQEERKIVESNGGRFIFRPTDLTISTTNILKKLYENNRFFCF